MIEALLAPFQFPFMQQAFAAALLVALPMGLISSFLILKGWSLMGDAISHAVLPGVVLAYAAGLPLAAGAFAAGMGCALLTGYLKENSRVKEDTVMGVVFSGMFGAGIVLFSMIESELHLLHVLFGDMLGTNWPDIVQAGAIAAAVIGAMQAIARLELPARVIGVAPLVENCIGAHAYKPGDVLTALDGTTVFVENTDAEGRLVLADCLTWASRSSPDLVIDLATLTAASDTALGPSFAALFTNDDAARGMLMDAGYDTGELLWPMPIHGEHRSALRHHLANMRNMGSQAGAASIAAAFLHHFTCYPWAHIDMAGRAVSAIEGELMGVGATGFGTRLLVRAAQRFAQAAEDGGHDA